MGCLQLDLLGCERGYDQFSGVRGSLTWSSVQFARVGFMMSMMSG